MASITLRDTGRYDPYSEEMTDLKSNETIKNYMLVLKCVYAYVCMHDY